jgi:hypothetical protein
VPGDLAGRDSAGGGLCVLCRRRLAHQPVNWYLRSITDRDTHRGELLPDGTVRAFRPRGAVRLPARRRAGMSGVCQGCRVTGSARRAVSPRDFCVHLLSSEGGHLPGPLKARCGHLLPTAVTNTTSHHQARRASPAVRSSSRTLGFRSDWAVHQRPSGLRRPDRGDGRGDRTVAVDARSGRVTLADDARAVHRAATGPAGRAGEAVADRPRAGSVRAALTER